MRWGGRSSGSLLREEGVNLPPRHRADWRTRYGTSTSKCTGEVPRFWKEIMRSYETLELVENVDQNWYRISVVVLGPTVKHQCGFDDPLT